MTATDLPEWAQQPDTGVPASPSWTGTQPPQQHPEPPVPDPATPPAGPTQTSPPAWTGPASPQRLDDIEVEAQKLGFLLIPADVECDPEAVRLVGRDQTAKGVGFNHDQHLVAAWPDLPSPAEVEQLVALTGHTIFPAVAGKTTFKSLEWQTEQILNDNDYEITLEPMVEMVLQQGASDLHISTGERPWTRVGGTFMPLPRSPRLSAEDTLNMARQIVGDDFDPETFNGDLDTSITTGQTRFRVNLYRERGQLGMALRTIPMQIPRFDTLGLPQSALKMTGMRSGLVIVAGATGSGKSTSLASLLDIINEDRDLHIVTLEAPIEYVHSSKRSLVHQREIGEDTADFKRALKSVLRQDPDIILVGEMRDYEEISLAITAAETGHLVFATVHAHNTAGVIDRVIDVFPSEEQNQVRAQLANTLLGVIAQKLLPDAQDSKRRHLAYEIAFVNDAIRSVIQNPEQSNAKITEALATSRNEGMMPFDGCLAMLVSQDKITREEAARNSIDRDVFESYLQGFRNRQ